jgi:hypothetical protein
MGIDNLLYWIFEVKEEFFQLYIMNLYKNSSGFQHLVLHIYFFIIRINDNLWIGLLKPSKEYGREQ